MMEIRRAHVNDAEEIADVHVRSWQGGYRGLIRQDYLDGLHAADRVPMRRQMLAAVDWIHSGSLVVTEDQTIVGFADFGPARDDDADTRRTAEVMAIYLAPEAWGKGFGRELMAAASSSLRTLGYTETTLWVLDTNARARKFYEAAGFQPDGAVKVDDSRGLNLRELRYRRQLG